jgi:predicted alpha/beta-fold hydrolase
LAGNSFGAAFILNYLGEEGDKSFVTAAFCNQPPMKTHLVIMRLEKYCFGLFNYLVHLPVKAKFLRNKDFIKKPFMELYGIDIDHCLQNSKTFTSFQADLCPIYGYKPSESLKYLEENGCNHRIPKVKIPVLILEALDDSIQGINHIDYESCYQNPFVILGTTKGGGHIGTFEDIFSFDQWFTKPGFDFLNSFKSDNQRFQ